MSECLSTQEILEKSPADTNMDLKSNILNQDIAEKYEELPLVQEDNLSSHSSYDNKAQNVDGEEESFVNKEGDEKPASPAADDELSSEAQADDINNPGSTESGEVSEEYNSETGSPTKKSVCCADVDDPENRDEFFDDDRSQTPLQDEQETELCLKATAYLNTDDASSEYVLTGAQPNEILTTSPQPEQNTDGELSDDDDDDKTSQGLALVDVKNVAEVGKLSPKKAKVSTEKKAAVTDDYGELDYEEEEAAEDNLEKGKSGEERKKKKVPTATLR